MPDDTYWESTRADLLLLVERLRPDDALAIVRELVTVEREDSLAPMLAGMIRGHIGRRDDEARRRGRGKQ